MSLMSLMCQSTARRAVKWVNRLWVYHHVVLLDLHLRGRTVLSTQSQTGRFTNTRYRWTSWSSWNIIEHACLPTSDFNYVQESRRNKHYQTHPTNLHPDLVLIQLSLHVDVFDKAAHAPCKATPNNRCTWHTQRDIHTKGNSSCVQLHNVVSTLQH